MAVNLKAANGLDPKQGKPNLGAITRILDPLLSDNFRLSFPTLPAGLINGVGTGTVGAEEALSIQCRTATKPGTQIEPVAVDLFGHSLQYAGRLTFSHSMSIEFVEDRRMVITKVLTNWQRLARRINTQHGGYKQGASSAPTSAAAATVSAQGYATNADLYVYDQAGGAPMAQFTIVNIWPSDVPDVSFDGSGANLITVSATFTYDFHIDTAYGDDF